MSSFARRRLAAVAAAMLLVVTACGGAATDTASAAVDVAESSGAESSGAVAAAAGSIGIAAKNAKAAAGSNDRIRIGFIGPGSRGFGAHVKKLCALHKDGRKVDLVGVAEVYENQRDKVADYIKAKTGTDPGRYVDYGEMI